MAAKKAPIKAIKKAAKKVKGTGVLMTKKEKEELLKSPSRKKTTKKQK